MGAPRGVFRCESAARVGRETHFAKFSVYRRSGAGLAIAIAALRAGAANFGLTLFVFALNFAKLEI